MTKDQGLSLLRSAMKTVGAYILARNGDTTDGAYVELGIGITVLFMGLAWSWCEHADIEICQKRGDPT